jgi:hypothetical protein
MEELNSLLELDYLPMNTTLSEYIKDMNLNELYVAEMVNATLRAFFNHQDKNVLSAFLILGLLGIPEYQIKGGNSKLINAIVDDCKKSKNFNLLLNTEVQAISKSTEGGRYNITSSKGANEYDLVVIAAPLSTTGVKFNDKLDHLNKFRKSPTANPSQVSFIEGELNENTFQTTKFPRKLIPLNLLTSAKITGLFNLGNRLFRVHSATKIHQNELEALNIFKSDFKIINTHSWSYASARFDPVNVSELPGYELDKGLLYTNAHEPVDTSMECALISSTNLYNLIEEMYSGKTKDVKRDDL